MKVLHGKDPVTGLGRTWVCALRVVTKKDESVLARHDRFRPRRAPPPPVREMCAVTNPPVVAKYRDPKTGLPYASLSALREIRRLYGETPQRRIVRPSERPREAALAHMDEIERETVVKGRAATELFAMGLEVAQGGTVLGPYVLIR